MDTKDTQKLFPSDNILLTDTNYYKYIFKKTEKIVCVVFYIVNSSNNGQTQRMKDVVEESAKKTLEAVLATLTLRPYGATKYLYTLVNNLVSLGSSMRVAHAAGFVEQEVVDMVGLEIESILKSLRGYLGHDQSGLLHEKEESPHRAGVSVARQRMSTENFRVDTAYKGQISSRKEAIKDILRVVKNATIKDISNKIKDCSEKTLQRELISMIKDGLVIKEGERRWSTYSLA